MANNKSWEQNILDAERERFSNFVVDLRPAAKRLAQGAGQTVRQAEKTIRRTGKTVLKAEKKIEKRVEKKFRAEKKRIFKAAPKINWSEPETAWPRFGWSRRPAWPARVRADLKILNTPVKASVLRRRAMSQADKQADRAETKIRWYRALLSFVIVLLILIIPLKLLSYFKLLDFHSLEQRIVDKSHLALNNLMAAADFVGQMDLKSADASFQKAGGDFLSAQDDLNGVSDGLLSLAALSGDPKMKLASESRKFLTAGALAASLGENLVKATDGLFGDQAENFSFRLDKFLNYGHLAVAKAADLKDELAKINPANLPDDYRVKFDILNKQAGVLANGLSNFVGLGDNLKEILGLSRDKRYLLVFQNNAELRASGGFLGSYALVDIHDGKITNLEVPGGGSYDTEGGMKVLVTAPQPLWLVNPLWHFWDANWWPDWPTTAQNLMWFYGKSDGPSVDGVISVTPTVVERLLEITGPIDLTKEYGLTIDANNFWDTVQTVVEVKNLAKTNPEALSDLAASASPALATRTAPIATDLPLKQNLNVNSDNKPKKIIGDLMAKIIAVLPQKLTKDNLGKILTAFESSLSEKQILMYFNDPTMEAAVLKRNWGGEVRAADKDYLLVVDTNIAGQKTDREITETISQESAVQADGSIIDTVTITRAHFGVKNEAMTGVRNVDWLRVYAPLGSQLISADGFGAPDAKYLQERPDKAWENIPALAAEKAALVEPSSGTKIYAEKDKTVFANWLMVDPGENATVVLKYRLPFNFFSKPADNSWQKRISQWLNPDQAELVPYSLLWQKQPGAKPAKITSRLILPAGYSIFWRYPGNLGGGDSAWQTDGELSGDQYLSILFKAEAYNK